MSAIDDSEVALALEVMREANRYCCYAIAALRKVRENSDTRKVEKWLTAALDVLQAEIDETKEAVRDGSTHPEDGDSPRPDPGDGGVGDGRLGGLARPVGRSAGVDSEGASVGAGA